LGISTPHHNHVHLDLQTSGTHIHHLTYNNLGHISILCHRWSSQKTKRLKKKSLISLLMAKTTAAVPNYNYALIYSYQLFHSQQWQGLTSQGV
jgi:hypothetical protein